jgi:hypothetical protein
MMFTAYRSMKAEKFASSGFEGRQIRIMCADD